MVVCVALGDWHGFASKVTTGLAARAEYLNARGGVQRGHLLCVAPSRRDGRHPDAAHLLIPIVAQRQEIDRTSTHRKRRTALPSSGPKPLQIRPKGYSLTNHIPVFRGHSFFPFL